MSQAPPALQRFTFSDALRDCFEPVFANFWTLALLSLLIVGLPYAVFAGIAGPPPTAQPGVVGDPMRAALFGLGQMANGTVQIFAAAFLQGAAAIVVVRHLTGGKATLRDALKGIGATWLALSVIALVTVLAAVVVVLIAVVPVAVLGAAMRPFGMVGVAIVAGVVAAIALMAVGAVLLAAWTASAPVAAVERVGPLAALRRSRQLSKGSRWAILGVMVLMAILSGVVSAVVALPASLLLGVAVAATGSVGLLWPVIAILQAVGASAGGLIYAAAPASVYWNLRRVKEGAASPDLAGVFD